MAESQSCPKCGLFNPPSALICDCGYNFATQRVGPPTDGRARAIVRPWVRYWARMFDGFVWALVTGFVVGIVAADAFSGPSGGQLFGMLVLFIWVFVEAFLLVSWGTTPGKWLLRVEIVPPATGSLSYSAALRRSFRVWWQGLGAGFPIIPLFTLAYAYKALKRDSITTWDQEGGFIINHQRIGMGRLTVVIVCGLVLVALVVLSRVVAV